MFMSYWPVWWMKPRALMKQINKLGMWTGESGREGLTKLSLPFLVLNLKKKTSWYNRYRGAKHISEKENAAFSMSLSRRWQQESFTHQAYLLGVKGREVGFIDPEKLLNCCSGWAGACPWPPLQLTIYTIFKYMDLMPSVTQDQNVKNMIKFRPEQNFCDWRLWGREQI